MGDTFRVGSHENATLAYFDICGTTNFYQENTIDIVKRRMTEILFDFELNFSKVFGVQYLEHFNINIYADSIMIYKRRIDDSILEKLIELMVSFQLDLLINRKIISRSIISKGDHFYLNLDNGWPSSILGSKHTSVSLCGGKGLVEMDKALEGLPAGLYIHEEFLEELNADQRNKLVKVEGEPLYFLKMDDKFIRDLVFNYKCPSDEDNFLISDEDVDKFTNGLNTEQSWRDLLKLSIDDTEERKKLLPFFAAHLADSPIKRAEKKG